MAQADEAVIGQLRDYVLQPEIVEGAVQDALDALRPKAGDLKSRRTELQAEIRNIDEAAARLTAAIASGGELQSLVKALKDRDKQRVHGQRELDMLERLTNVSDLDVGRIERDLRARVKDWRSLLRRQTPVSRQILTKLLADRLVFVPRAEEGGYDFSGEAQLGKLMQGVVLPQVWRPKAFPVGTASTAGCSRWICSERPRRLAARTFRRLILVFGGGIGLPPVTSWNRLVGRGYST